MRGILYYQGLFLGILALMMLAPAAFAYAYGDLKTFKVFFVILFFYLFIAGSVIFALRGQSFELERSEQMILLVLVWCLIPLAGALPFYNIVSNLTFADAFFESVSGFTTTGATVLTDVAALPKALILWRSLLNWLGGLTTYIVVIMLLKPLLGTELFGRELHTSGYRQGQKFDADIESALNIILPIYMGITLLCLLLLMLTGIDKFEALCLSYSAVSTGGFMPHSGNLQTYGLYSVELILAFFMFIGSVSILWVQSLVHLRWRQVFNIKEPFIIMLVILALGLFIAWSILSTGYDAGSMTTTHALTLGVATAASLVSTTGIPISNFTEGSVPYILILTLVIIGGGRFSTAGGVKFYRIGEMLRLSIQEIERLIHPNIIVPGARRNKLQSELLVQSVWTHFSVIILLICIIAVALSISGVPFASSFMAAASALSNFGPAYQFVDFQTPKTTNIPSYTEMSSQAKLILSTAMIIGRVEVLAFLALFNIAVWRQ